MTTSMIGKTLRGYELTDHIGSGGFGAVYRAQQQVIGREVAIKVILPEFANSPAFVRRFDTEAKFVAKLEHPHIVPLFDYWRDPAGAYLVMRYVSGGSLTTILKERSMTLAEIARFLDEITAALSIAHRSGVVHLDLKPDNILLDEDGNTYLTDFGIAKTVGDRPDKEAEGRISGTLAYTSPEQLQSKPPTQQSDIYSLGIILYEMLTGQHPFESKSATGMIYAHLTEDIPHLDETRPDLPLLYDDIVQKATEKDPADRYQDVREIALAFRSAIENQNANITAEMLVSLDAAQNPYMGLRPFEETDADNFFGRQEAIDELIGRMQGANFLAVVGPSGSGKSSLVKAGLLPALKRGEVDDSADWFYINMVPGTAPIENLAQALTSIATRSLSRVTGILRAHPESLHEIVTDMLQDQAGDVLLTIDQFEEVFTQVDSEDERLQFLEAIRYAVTRPQPRIRVIVTLRADFYDRPLHYEGFGSLIQQNTQVVLPLSTAELEQAIVGPADRIGVYPDADLIARMIADVREEPGALPLLQYALTEVFERREGARLTLEAYQDTGGVSGALARRAEEIFQGLSDEKQRITRQIFLRMVTLGEGEEDTRRRVRYSGLLTLGDNEQVQAVLDEYGKYRLLTFDNDPDTREPLVEVAHEALIREWQRLRDWLYTSRGDVRQQRALNQGAADWNTNHREVSFLLRGARLDQAEEWAASTDLVLTGLEREFLDASIAERTRLQQIEQERIKREQALEEQARQRLRYLVGVLTLAAAVSIGLMLLAFNRSQAESVARATSEFNASVANTQVAIAATAEQVAVDERQIAQQQADLAATAEQVALDERQIAEEQAVRAQSLALSSAAQLALLDSNLDAAAALALQANSIENAPQQAQLVLAQIAYSPGTRQLFQFDGTVDTVDINGSGTRAVTASRDDSLTLWNTETGEALQQFEGHTDRVTSVAITPDGTRIVSGSRDETAIVWNTDTGARVATLAGHTDNILAVTINDTGSLVVTGSSDGTARLWRVRTGESTLTFEGHDG
ncbi:MAG: protein kinase, partial [Chloroflexota bacterium]